LFLLNVGLVAVVAVVDLDLLLHHFEVVVLLVAVGLEQDNYF
jgi:hypothetical protein